MLRYEQVEVSRGSFKLGPLQCQAAAGAVTVVVGPNASGKTTLLHTAAGIITPDRGAVYHKGADVRLVTAPDRAAEIVLLPQRPVIDLPLSVERLVELGRLRQSQARAREYIELAIEQFGLADLRDRPVASLSAGQAQRAHLARVWAQRGEAATLVLDEPTAPLDHRWAGQVWSHVREHARSGGSVLVAVHDLGVAADAADEAWLLREGQLAAAGPGEQVLQPEVLGDAFEASFEWAQRRDGSRWLVPGATR